MTRAIDTGAPWTERLKWRSAAEITGRMLRSLSTWAWALHLSADAFGALAHAWAVNLLLAQAFGLALPALLLREASARPEQAAALYRRATSLRLWLLVPELAAFAALGLALDFRPLAPYVLLLLAVSLSALQDLAGHYLMARGEWRAEARATLVSGFMVAALSAAAMLTGGGVAAAAASVVAGNALGLMLALAAVRRAAAPASVSAHLPWRTIAPWAVFMLLEQSAYHFETVWLDAAASHTAVAHFSAVYRVLGLSGPMVLVAGQLLLPQATRLARGEVAGAALTKLSRAGLGLGLLAGVAASLVLALVLPAALPLVVPFADEETARVASRLSFLLPFWFANTSLVQVALARARMGPLIGWGALVLVSQAGLCAMLVPSAGATGAATAKLGASALSTLGLCWVVRRELLGRQAQSAP